MALLIVASLLLAIGRVRRHLGGGLLDGSGVIWFGNRLFLTRWRGIGRLLHRALFLRWILFDRCLIRRGLCGTEEVDKSLGRGAEAALERVVSQLGSVNLRPCAQSWVAVVEIHGKAVLHVTD